MGVHSFSPSGHPVLSIGVEYVSVSLVWGKMGIKLMDCCVTCFCHLVWVFSLMIKCSLAA